jgi:Transmembrane domain of unknown function (DUF3566)
MAVRRVRRIVRRIDPWTVLKVSLVFNAIAGLTFVLGIWVLWSLSLQRGIPDRIIEIFERITLTLTIDGELYFRVVVLLAIVGAIVLTGLFTLGAVLYNLIADLVGGVEITVLEETFNPNPAGTRTVLRQVARTPVEPPLAAAVAAGPIEEASVAIEAAPPDEVQPAAAPVPESPVEPDEAEDGARDPVAVPTATDAAGNGDARGAVSDKTAVVEDNSEEVPDPVGTA